MVLNDRGGTVDGSEILHQLRLVVYPIIYSGEKHPNGGCFGFLPSTVSFHGNLRDHTIFILFFPQEKRHFLSGMINRHHFFGGEPLDSHDDTRAS